MSSEQRLSLRKDLEMRLKDVPDGKRLQLPVEDIEAVLFDVYKPIININNDPNIDIVNNIFKGVKVPITWDNDLLSKLDLSGVSFENVIFSAEPMWQIIDDFLGGGNDEDYYDEISHITSFCSPIGLAGIFEGFATQDMKQFGCILDHSIKFANTNIKIDFRKVFRYKDLPILLRYCDFSGVDLRESNISCIGLIKNSSFCNSNLNGVSLSISALRECCFTGSGVNIVYNDNNECISRLADGSLLLDGCYINGNMINYGIFEEGSRKRH